MMAGFEELRPFAPPEAYQDHDPARKRTSQFFAAAELAGKLAQPRRWLVDGLVPSGTVTMLSGDGGVGKSLLSLQLAVAIAAGRPWLGCPVEGAGALFVSAEDDQDELHRRLRDIASAETLDLADLRNLTIRSLAGEDALLCHGDRSGALRPTDLFDELDQRIGDDKPALVALDTLSDMFPGNENDRVAARQFIGLLRGLAIRHQTAVLLLSHPSLTGLSSGSGTSGSTGWNNSVRSRLYLKRVADEGYESNADARVLINMKANYSRSGAEITLHWQKGVFVAEAAATGLNRLAGSAKAERVFLQLLRELTAEGRNLSAKTGHGYGRVAKVVEILRRRSLRV